MKKTNNGRIVMLALCAIGIALAGCGSEETKGHDAVTQHDINAVMQAHVGTLMAVPGVTAVAIGALDDGTPCIKVYVEEETGETRRDIPKTLDGHPVVVEVSGKIEPMTEG